MYEQYKLPLAYHAEVDKQSKAEAAKFFSSVFKQRPNGNNKGRPRAAFVSCAGAIKAQACTCRC